MLSAFFSRARACSLLLLLPAACALAATASCGGAPAPVVVRRTETPSGRAAPRTSLPMPPASGASAEAAQSFTLNDQRARVSDYLGKVVVLDFWATFCPPCRDEAPHLDALQRRFADKGLIVIGLNVGGPEDRPEIPRFIEETKIKYAMGFPEPEMVNLYMGSDDRIPQTVVFDRTGRVLRHFVGYDPAISKELERTIEEAVTSD